MLAIGAGLVLSASAAEVLGVSASHVHDRYKVQMNVALSAPPQRVFAALEDYQALPRINPDVREVRILARQPDGLVRLYTRIHACVAFFCRTLRQVQDMRAEGDGHGGRIDARIVPEQSDFSAGVAHWRVRACRSGWSCLRFDAELQPKFWVPPLIGSLLIEHKMRQEAVATAAGLERIARGVSHD